MSEIALDNYGEKYRNTVFEITHRAKNVHEHPGYDESVYPDGLNDLRDIKTGESFGCSLYDYELRPA